jgi:predicted nucleic acid-binding protein
LVAIDTSVLVADALTVHPFHARAWPWIEAVEHEELEGTVCVHALAELYSVLTRLRQELSAA